MAEEDNKSLLDAIRDQIGLSPGYEQASRHPWMGTVPTGVVTREGMDRLINNSPEGNVIDRRHNYGGVTGALQLSGLPWDAQSLDPRKWMYEQYKKVYAPPQPPSPLGNQAGYEDIE